MGFRASLPYREPAHVAIAANGTLASRYKGFVSKRPRTLKTEHALDHIRDPSITEGMCLV